MTHATDVLWEQYRRQADPETRAALLSQHVGLVHHVARPIAARVGDAVSYEDLVGAGMLGLVQAFESFDPGREVAFSTYATQRIRGSVLDELRAADPRTRLVRTRTRRLIDAETTLNRALGRAPEPAEVATSLGITLDDYWEWDRTRETPVPVALDSPVIPGVGGPTLAETIPSPDTPAPDAALLQEERLAGLRAAIATLPEQQRMVLTLCYFEELNLRQIAEVLHVTESRISQVRTAALASLRQTMQADDFR